MISDEYFSAVIRFTIAHGITPMEMADGLSVSLPTICRWHNGRNLPMQAMRAAVLKWIRER